MRSKGMTRVFGVGFLLAAFLVLGAVSSAVRAEEQGFYLEQKVVSSGVMGQPPREDVSRIYVGQNRMKMISGGPESMEMIFDKGASAIYMIDPQAKTYIEITEKDFQAMLQMGMAMMEGMLGKEPPQVTRTGEKAKVGQWDAEKVLVTMSGEMAMTIEMWITHDLKIDMDRYFDMAELMGQSGFLKAYKDKLAEIGGFPVRTKSSMNIMGTKVESESTLQTLREETLPAATFRVPEGFTKKEGNFMQAMQEFQASKQEAQPAH